MDGNVGGDRSHVQEGFGRRLKEEGLIYPRNDPKQVNRALRNYGQMKHAAEKSRQLCWKDLCCSTAV